MPDRPWVEHYPPGLAASGKDYPDRRLEDLLQGGASGRVALVAGGIRWTYEKLRERVEGVAGWLVNRGLTPGDRVLLRLPNGPEFVVAYYGALRAGGIVVAASPDARPVERARQVELAGPALTIDAATEVGSGDPPPPATEDVAALQFTSGTTGRAKAATMSHGNLVANALQNARWFGWTEREVNLCVLPLFHTWGMCVGLNSTFAVGGTLVLAPRVDAAETLALVARHEATVLYGSATMFHRLLDEPARPLPSLRHVKAGAMLSQGGLKERWDAAYPGAPLQQGYGLTEASPESHNNPPQRFKPGTVGVPIQDTDCRIADPDDPARVLPPGTAGEVCLRGPQVTRGYWRDDAATAAAFHDGWLRTGDIGVMDDEGYLTIVDRKKDMLKFRGYTVSPNSVEERLLAHGAVREAVVVGAPDERDGEIPVAFVVLDRAVDDAALTAHCHTGLARYEVPRRFVRLDAIPKNAVGKPLRRVLRDRIRDA